MGEEEKKDAPKRPEPPAKVENPLPTLANAMKEIGAMQVLITKVVEELEEKRQKEYIAACKEFDGLEDGKKAKEEADKQKDEYMMLKREVKRLKAKLEKRPCPPLPDLHPMAVEKIIDNVLNQEDFDKANLKNFCVICKAWQTPVRTRMFKDLSDLQVSSRQRCDGLTELLTTKQSLYQVVKAITFSFQPADSATRKEDALRECLPSPLQFMLLLTVCAEAKKLTFTNMATFGATKVILSHIADRIEEVALDPAGYAWHSKEVDFGANSRSGLFGSWPNLAKLSITRVRLNIESPNSYDRRSSASSRIARCPLTHLSLEKVRLDGRIYHMLGGAMGRLTHLSLKTIGSLSAVDLCQVITEHEATLTNLTLIALQVVDSPLDDDDDDDSDDEWAWGGGSTPIPKKQGQRATFDRAMNACVNLTHLDIEPGCLPVFQHAILFRPLAKLENLQCSTRRASSYNITAWAMLLGLLPVLSEQKRKLKKIHFGHDWNSDDRRVRKLETQWKKVAEVVSMGRLPPS